MDGLGYQILACPGLAVDQDGGIMRGVRIDALAKGLHDAAFSKDIIYLGVRDEAVLLL